MGSQDKRSDSYLRDALTVLFKRKWFIITVFLLVLFGTTAGVLLAVRDYEASAILMITRARGEHVMTPSVNGQGDLTFRLNPTQDLNAETELIKRRSLLVQVVRTLGTGAILDGRLPGAPGQDGGGTEQGSLLNRIREAIAFAKPAVAAPVRALASLNAKVPITELDAAVLSLSTQVKVLPMESANLIKLSLPATDPRYAATVLDLLVRNYLEEYPRVRQGSRAVQFFEEQTTRLAAELRTAEDAKQQLELEFGIIRLGNQQDQYIRVAVEHETNLQNARTEIDELREKSRVLREQLATLPEKIRTSEEMRANPVIDTMRTRLLELEMERNKLLQKYTANDRRVQDAEREIQLLRDRFLAESTWEFARETYGYNPARTTVMLDLINTETQLVRATVKASNLERDLDGYKATLERLTRVAYVRARLDRKVRLLDDLHELYAKKSEEARIGSAMDQSQIVNIALAEPVQVSAKPGVGGRPGTYFVILGAAFGLVAGVGGAFTREYFDHSFTTAESLQRHAGLPVLGAISEEKK